MLKAVDEQTQDEWSSTHIHMPRFALGSCIRVVKNELVTAAATLEVGHLSEVAAAKVSALLVEVQKVNENLVTLFATMTSL